VAIDRLPDGRRVLHAQLVTDAPDVVWLESRIELSAQGRHLALEVRSEGSEGAGEVSLRRLGSVVRVAGKLPVFGEFHLERRIDDEAELGAEGFSEIVPEPFAAAALAHASWHGEGARQVLVLGADPTLERDRWEVAAGEAGAGPLALTVRRQQSRQTRTVRLDADGRLADLTIQWFGVIGVHRVPR